MKQLVEAVSPEHDERVHTILTKLAQGMSRDELAGEFNHKDYKSIDAYMRKKGYRYDRYMKNYVPQIEEQVIHVNTSKATRVIELLKVNTDEPMLVCQKLGFKDMQEIGDFMGMKGYQWNTELNNYERKPQEIATGRNELIEEMPRPTATKEVTEVEQTDLASYLSLLKLLKHNEERLTEILIPYGKGGSIPRYTIVGVAQTKTVQMINTLSNLVSEFARENNMTQRDLFEVALVDFFRKYGYEKEVVQVLNGR
ncbi:hypothetical protein [Sporosarcina gallistercoris]|uniref:Uncharacterized protein n=1 Tax=Sporosarcina gallistercoris TaxID=2762245 RepID=A0ABR8PLQ8_9BACL|nr:hypothetical protein [Sporosarcina gallistercoris]MBD7909110.1 hypothetical protein [Sporosarcina gallistercoris]